MPISLNFDKEITNKAAVEAAVEINTSSGQDVVGHWFGDKRLDFRPQNYWQADTHVTVTLDFNGLEGAPGITGVQDRTFSFDVGRSQISTVDARTHQMTVVRDGRTLRTVPISAGSEENPTYNGAMVISEKFEETRMNGATVGFTDDDGKGEYDIPDVPHAMRLSTSGTFIHGNYWSAPEIFGSTNTSHGCVGLADVQARATPSRTPPGSTTSPCSATWSSSSTRPTRPSSPTTASTAGTWTGTSGRPAAPVTPLGGGGFRAGRNPTGVPARRSPSTLRR